MNKHYSCVGGGYTAPAIEVDYFVTEGGFTTSVEFIEGLEPDDTLTWD